MESDEAHFLAGAVQFHFLCHTWSYLVSVWIQQGSNMTKKYKEIEENCGIQPAARSPDFNFCSLAMVILLCNTVVYSCTKCIYMVLSNSLILFVHFNTFIDPNFQHYYLHCCYIYCIVWCKCFHIPYIYSYIFFSFFYVVFIYCSTYRYLLLILLHYILLLYYYFVVYCSNAHILTYFLFSYFLFSYNFSVLKYISILEWRQL